MFRLTGWSHHAALKVYPGYLVSLCCLKSEVKQWAGKEQFGSIWAQMVCSEHYWSSALQPLTGYMSVLPTTGHVLSQN